MKERLKNLLCRDLSVRALLLLGLGFTLVKLILTSFQLVLATPDFAILDDTLMYEAAKSITEGQWLGEYNWLTLGKYMFFPVWLAMLHTLHIPYLLGGQLLQMIASLAGAWALAPLIRRRWGLLLQDYSGGGVVFRHGSLITVETPESFPWTLDGEYGPGVERLEIRNLRRRLIFLL